MNSMTRPDPALDFRRALGQFATGVAVVTCAGRDGRSWGVTVNSFSSVSLVPRLVLWSLQRTAPSRAAFEVAPGFAIHVLSDAQRELSDRFCRPAPDKFAALDLGRNAEGAPVLEGCLARLECRLHRWHDGGDHVIFVGEVARWTTAPGRPLVFHAGAYQGLAPDLL